MARAVGQGVMSQSHEDSFNGAVKKIHLKTTTAYKLYFFPLITATLQSSFQETFRTLLVA